MIHGGVPCFEININGGVGDAGDLYSDVMNTSLDGAGGRLKTQSMRSFQLSLLVLKEKVGEVESFVSFSLAQENHHLAQTQLVYEPISSMAFSSMASLMQEIVETASSMMLNCQQMALGSTHEGHNNNNVNSNCEMLVNQELHTMQHPYNRVDKGYNEGLLDGDSLYQWYVHNNSFNNSSNNITTGTTSSTTTTATTLERYTNEARHEVVEVDVEDLLARYTHYCQVCGRGFKREANLRMHMRAHGDMYKSSTLVSNNPLKKKVGTEDSTAPRKYSCPQEGCRWNKNHVKFQPLKSMVCVRNHYKRSHCPKMFVCKRCNTKEFSVLSDLKTHEKHCGEINWYCSCGTSFSKKDKLMDHVALFVGHSPLITSGYQFGQQP